MTPEQTQYATERISMILDKIGEFPIGKMDISNAKPNKFEKLPRELIAYLELYNKVEPAMAAWKSKIERIVRGRKKEEYRLSLKQMNTIENEIDKLEDFLLTADPNKDDLRHWKASLLGRIMNVMANSWMLAQKYAERHVGEADAFEEERIKNGFSIEMHTYALELGVSDSRLQKTLDIAEEHLMNRLAYYKSFKKEGE